MKTIIALFVVCMLTGSCSTPKKTAPKRKAIAVTPVDKIRGGTSFSDPIVISLKSEREVLDEEYKWLSQNYPGYSLIKRSHQFRAPKHYDIIRIKIQPARVHDVYFDCTQFWGKK